MKTQAWLIAFCFALLIGTPAAAFKTEGSHLAGIIQKVNAKTFEAEILREDSGTHLTFVWNSATKFVANEQVVNASILKKGARVEVILYVVIFGKPFVTKVTLLPATTRGGRAK